MKMLAIILAIIILVIIGYFVWATLFRDAGNENITYGTDSSPQSQMRYELDCARRGGVLNKCGSNCPVGSMCPSVCVFICEFKK